MDLLLAKLLVLINIIRNQEFKHPCPHLFGEGVVREHELTLILVDAGRRAVDLEGVSVVQLIVILGHVELVAKVLHNGQETFDPVQVLLERDEPIVVLVDLGEYFVEDGLLELVQFGEVEGVLEHNDEFVPVQGLLGNRVVPAVSAQSQLCDQVEEVNGEGFEADHLVVELQ